ncbi:hypothetical protein [Flavivirga eckloniae]|uniref:Uncharacterized protein n=1 Tax=Flavivirga eckloniae TaxID=1803846 RepID=A0A2K9PV51_9FLAO|nr:hypothetical protein [Flavivirga eckloniae]AUP80397.1 hypothetical protein C1H87_17440 [Flavivirga eckloniae]
MKTLKKTLRLFALIFIIALASVLPVPMVFYKKDNLPKYTIELIEKKNDDTESEDIKEIH